MDTEASLLRIQSPVSELVDSTIRVFMADHEKERMQGYLRWHGADLWMIYAPIAETVLLRRVTVAAYSDHPDDLLFTPDVVAEKPEGRYLLPSEVRRQAVMKLSIFGLMRGLLLNGHQERSTGAIVMKVLEAAWAKSAALAQEKSDILVLLP